LNGVVRVVGSLWRGPTVLEYEFERSSVTAGGADLHNFLVVGNLGVVFNELSEQTSGTISPGLACCIGDSADEELKGGQPLLAVNYPPSSHSSRRSVIALKNNCAEEVRMRVAFLMVVDHGLEVLPKRLPVTLALPDIWALVARDLVLDVGTEELFDRDLVRLHDSSWVPLMTKEAIGGRRLARLVFNEGFEAIAPRIPITTSMPQSWALDELGTDGA
jgi:hypothetical protein